MFRLIPLLLATHSFATTVIIQDFKTQIYHGESAHPNLWAMELSPPVGHHFNIEAPRSAQTDKIKWDLIQESTEKLIFQTENSSLHFGSSVEVNAFVCDEQKTYCMKKKMQVVLEEKNSKKISEKFSAKKESKNTPASVAKKELELFIDNDVARALEETKNTKKPVLIDFYGIWCPPCNLYNETIFNTKKFEEESKKFVLLKMDVDDEKSFELKSKFKIGGYPTLLIAKLDSNGSWEEVERIVGYFPPKEFYARLNQAYQRRNDSLEKRWKGRLEELLTSLLEQKKYDEMIKLTEGNPEAKILIYRWIAEMKKNPDFLKTEKNLSSVKTSIESIAKNAQKQSSDTIMHLVDFLNDEFWLKQSGYYPMANRLLDQLAQRIDPSTLFVKGTELTAPDLDSMRMDLAETMGDQAKVSEARKMAIQHYEKLIALLGKNIKRDLRSMNLEYAFLLWKDERIDQAKKLYDQFIQKYPAEFTFYFAASKMYLTIKDYSKARELAEKAYQYSYGDNRLRAMDRLVSVMGAQGQKKEAISRGNEFLKTVKVPEGLDVRTGRYVDALKKTMAGLEKTEEVKK